MESIRAQLDSIKPRQEEMERLVVDWIRTRQELNVQGTSPENIRELDAQQELKRAALLKYMLQAYLTPKGGEGPFAHLPETRHVSAGLNKALKELYPDDPQRPHQIRAALYGDLAHRLAYEIVSMRRDSVTPAGSPHGSDATAEAVRNVLEK